MLRGEPATLHAWLARLARSAFSIPSGSLTLVCCGSAAIRYLYGFPPLISASQTRRACARFPALPYADIPPAWTVPSSSLA